MIRVNTPRQHYYELERLMGAAANNPALAARLIADPAAALETWDHRARFSAVECVLICSIIGAADIDDFAGRLYGKMQRLGIDSKFLLEMKPTDD